MNAGAADRDLLVVVQPTAFCNIDCTYCYLPHRASKARLAPALIDRLAEGVCAARWWTGHCTFLWHLGEPLTLPVAWYEDAFGRIDVTARRHDRSVSHAFQTNATLVDEAWAKFLAAHRTHVGASVDGPAFLHDSARRTRAGGATHAATMRGIGQLQNAGIDLEVITVLTDASLDHADAMYAFYVDHGLHRVAFNIDEIEGVHTRTSFGAPAARERYRQFMRRFVGLVHARQGRVVLRELQALLPIVLRGAPTGNLGNEPLRVLTVDTDGNYSTFCPELRVARSPRFGDFVMGNLMRDELAAIRAHPVYRAVAGEIEAGRDACRRTCRYWSFCGGGDPSNKFFEHGRFDVTETATCRIHKQATVDAVVDVLAEVEDPASLAWTVGYGRGRTPRQPAPTSSGAAAAQEREG